MPIGQNQSIVITTEVAIAIDMTQAGLRFITHSDFPWGEAIITDEFEGSDEFNRFKEFVIPYYNEERTIKRIFISSYYDDFKKSVNFESRCMVHNTGLIWEPVALDIKIGDAIHEFDFINKLKNDLYTTMLIDKNSPSYVVEVLAQD